MDIANLPWGKYDPRSGLTHRLEHHCADVAACFEALLEEPLLRRRFGEAAGGGGLHDVTLARLTVLAFLHDFGKVSTGFQFKVGDRHRGVPRHQGHLKPFFWACQRPEVRGGVGLEQLVAWGAGLDQLLRAGLAHHGRPITGHSIEGEGPPEIWRPLEGYDPIAAGRELFRRARTWVPEAFGQGPELPSNPALAHLFAGVVAIADQIGSNGELFRPDPVLDSEYIDRARRRATKAVRRLGFTRSRWVPRAKLPDFEVLFPKWSPHRMQTAVAEAPLDSPLMILESETGSGKTEAAIWRFAKLWKAGLVDGLYFALPTRAAALQLHRRVHEALKRLLPTEARLETVLALPGYRQTGEATGWAVGWNVRWDDDPEEAERLARWSAESARKFLCAAAAVGTVDQALLAGLQVKWAHFRGASLARSLLVVDEVHASDAYMTRVLREVLRGHIEVGGHALLMSATLGSVARDQLTVGGAVRRRRGRTGKPEALGVTYPVLAVADHGGPTRFVSFDATGYQKKVSMGAQPMMRDPAAIADLAIRDARKGARVLVVRNTVWAATEVFDEVCGQGAEDLLLPVTGGPGVHHSRFAAEDRKLLDAAVERVLGKESDDGGRIVVGTQTLEQSLDIDADVLVTDLCPVDVLLQRIGRLHRHEDRSRPDKYSEPRCRVLVPEGRLDPEGLPRYGLGMTRTGGIYRDIRVVELTRRLILRHPLWSIPEMNRDLVEGATHPESLQSLEDELGEEWVDRSVDVEGRRTAERNVARGHMLDRRRDFGETTFPKRDERVRSRLGEDGPRIRLSEGVTGPFGREVTTFSLPAHLFRGQRGIPTKEEIDGAHAEPVEGGLVLFVGQRRFGYDRRGIRPMS
ncbi:MAG: CRISPR-associated helicase Cas3' [Gemmatimonadota bacterium]|nr:CRISPR-associated helicase Cas3' [Gemmatimonadota bacterium]MDE2983748.1 CRISPR-associated helicase Cas3' [Gemmatimonadota bacterium]